MANIQFPYDPNPKINLTRNRRPHFGGHCLMASANNFEGVAAATHPPFVRDMAQGRTGPIIYEFSEDGPRML